MLGAHEEAGWDAQALALLFARMTRHAVHGLRRGEWFAGLGHSVIAWQLPERAPRGKKARAAAGRVRFLVIERGQVVDRGDVPAGGRLPAPRLPRPDERLACFDRHTYDRLRVLSTELRRVVRESPYVAVRLGPRHVLERARLVRTLGWV